MDEDVEGDARSQKSSGALSQKTARTLATALSSRGVARAARQRDSDRRTERGGGGGDGDNDVEDDDDDDDDGDGLDDNLRQQLGLAVAAARRNSKATGPVRIRETAAGVDGADDDDDPVDLMGRSFVSRISSTRIGGRERKAG